MEVCERSVRYGSQKDDFEDDDDQRCVRANRCLHLRCLHCSFNTIFALSFFPSPLFCCPKLPFRFLLFGKFPLSSVPICLANFTPFLLFYFTFFCIYFLLFLSYSTCFGTLLCAFSVHSADFPICMRSPAFFATSCKTVRHC